MCGYFVFKDGGSTFVSKNRNGAFLPSDDGISKTTSDETRFLTLGEFSKKALKCSLFKSAIDNSSYDIMLCHKSIPFVEFFANVTEIAAQSKI